MADFNTFGTSFASFVAGGTISKNRAVKLDTTAGQVVACGAITDVAIGIATEDATSGYSVTVQLFGKAKVVASASTSVGDQLMPGSGGKVATAAGATAKSLGLGLQAAGADGDVIEVLLATPNVNGPANS